MFARIPALCKPEKFESTIEFLTNKTGTRNNKLTEASGFENLCKNGFSNAASNANVA